ncbi:unnamed protein product [Zymoseptoria tritici ST99CH_1A5]|uniref:Uncharacterized protein n=2 Tax=Zymoseptoria tritici TaxID=1047171 RepID=A0A2H1FXS9_ZYMTR|nr:unnamed protein product [Zymoseptoria tritici ST99CH_1E4]SMY21263.1 unnamed protein product [Zymoseptoria tritici ST99CH_1A5]
MPHSARVSTRADASHAQVVPAERADSQQDQHDRIDTDAAISDYSDTADAGAQRSLLDLRTALGATWSSQWNSVDGLMSAMLNTDDEGRQRIMALFTAYTDEVKNNEGAMPPPSDSEHGSSTSPASTTAPRSDSAFRGARLLDTYQKPSTRCKIKTQQHNLEMPDINDSSTRQSATEGLEGLLGPLASNLDMNASVRKGTSLEQFTPEVRDAVHVVTKAIYYESVLLKGEVAHPDISTNAVHNRRLFDSSEFVNVVTTWHKPGRSTAVADPNFTPTQFGGQVVKLKPFFAVAVVGNCAYGHLGGSWGGKFEESVPASEQHRFMQIVEVGSDGPSYPFDVLEVGGRTVRESSYLDMTLLCLPLDTPMAPSSGRMTKHSKIIFAIMKKRYNWRLHDQTLYCGRIDGEAYDKTLEDLESWEHYKRRRDALRSRFHQEHTRTNAKSMTQPERSELKRKRGHSDSSGTDVSEPAGGKSADPMRSAQHKSVYNQGVEQQGTTGITSDMRGLTAKKA